MEIHLRLSCNRNKIELKPLEIELRSGKNQIEIQLKPIVIELQPVKVCLKLNYNQSKLPLTSNFNQIIYGEGGDKHSKIAFIHDMTSFIKLYEKQSKPRVSRGSLIPVCFLLCPS